MLLTDRFKRTGGEEPATRLRQWAGPGSEKEMWLFFWEQWKATEGFQAGQCCSLILIFKHHTCCWAEHELDGAKSNSREARKEGFSMNGSQIVAWIRENGK